ncbi:glucose dehydrogenase [Ulvibacter litoralis]|nr:glucose dehydrogenase [Ulvibacter litoralis]
MAQDITLELIKDGFISPIDLQNVGDERLFVAEKGGRIKILNPDGSVNPILFLDITSLVSTGGEQGLLGLAFHPDYANNGHYFVNYTKTNGNTRVARFTTDPNDPNTTLPNSELKIIEYDQPYSNHNGGGIAFGPDGYLYIAAGDGGSSGDPENRAQNTSVLLGKLLRLDIDTPAPPNNYSIPSDNPFAGSTTHAQEIWAYGLRNPWRFSFDSITGDIWIGDVGQGDVEEIDRAQSSEGGLNYGWRCYEGSQTYNTSGCPSASELTFPFAEYSSSSSTSNCSITGGIVYRGGTFADLYGLYFYADVCSGLIGSVNNDGDIIEYGTFNNSWVSFGVDNYEELYIVALGGSIYKIIGEHIVNVSEFDSTNNIMMTPNPASESVHFITESGTFSSIEIVDSKGSVVLSEENINASEKNISLTSLSEGIYLAKITAENGNFSIKKLIIQ